MSRLRRHFPDGTFVRLKSDALRVGQVVQTYGESVLVRWLDRTSCPEPVHETNLVMANPVEVLGWIDAPQKE